MDLLSVLTARDLRALRLHGGVAQRRARDGQWRRVARGIYLPHDREPTPAELVAAARACAGPDAVVTGVLALSELGLPWLPYRRDVHVLVPSDRRRTGSDLVRITRTNDVHDLATWTRYGSRFADAPRATVDAARSMTDLRDVRGIVLGAAASRWTTATELRQLLDAGRRNGSALARRAIVDAERGCASPREAELVDALVGRGVPFYVNPEIWVAGVLLGHPDVWLLGRGVGGEVESRERHGSERDVESTYDRHERFVSAGIGLVHLGVRRIRADAGAAATHLLNAPWLPEPAGLRVLPRGPLLT
jgi:hypothetical protein